MEVLALLQAGNSNLQQALLPFPAPAFCLGTAGLIWIQNGFPDGRLPNKESALFWAACFPYAHWGFCRTNIGVCIASWFSLGR